MATVRKLDALDDVIHQKVRLGVMSSLIAAGEADFNFLKHALGVSDGNLSTHARRLESAGLVQISKHFRDARPVTTLELTLAGRDALEQHARRLLSVLSRTTETEEPAPVTPAAHGAAADDDEWVD